MIASLRMLSSKADSNTWESFTRSKLKLDLVHRVTTLRHLQEKGYQASSETETMSEASYLDLGEKKIWTVAQWSKVLFSDESKFSISFGNQGPRVWRKRGDAQNPCCLKSSVKFPQSVMIWAAMSSAGVGPLCFLKSTVNAAIYQDILEHFMLPSADKLYEDADFIFQQDLAPGDLKAAIKAAWASITPEQCHRLIAFMPRHIDAVIYAKGGPNKYWVHRNEHTLQKPDISV